MRSPSPSAGNGFRLRELTFLSMMGTLIFALKMALAALPNINLNAVVIILLASFFRWKALLSVAVYIFLEGTVFGFGWWWLCYWYLWPCLTALAVLYREHRTALGWAALAGAYGLCFGALCSVPFLFFGGWKVALGYWINGIPYDIIHCAGNFVSTLTLYKPLYAVMERLTDRTVFRAGE